MIWSLRHEPKADSAPKKTFENAIGKLKQLFGDDLVYPRIKDDPRLRIGNLKFKLKVQPKEIDAELNFLRKE